MDTRITYEEVLAEVQSRLGDLEIQLITANVLANKLRGKLLIAEEALKDAGVGIPQEIELDIPQDSE